MTIHALHREAESSLRRAGIERPGLDASVLLAFALGRDRTFVLAHGSDAVSARVARRFRSLVGRRTQSEPVAYIIGEKEFYGRSFAVNRHVLIPRPKTEAMVEQARAILEAWGHVPSSALLESGTDDTLVIDVGTGSGILAITVKALFPRVTVLAVDRSRRALAMAMHNAQRHGFRTLKWPEHLGNQGPNALHFLCSDLLSRVDPLAFRKILILANLPYVPRDEIPTLESDVRDYEPRLALDGGGDGLDLFRRLAKQVAKKFPDQTVRVVWECEEAQEVSVRAMFSLGTGPVGTG